jgi:hypothetical protein
MAGLRLQGRPDGWNREPFTSAGIIVVLHDEDAVHRGRDMKALVQNEDG